MKIMRRREKIGWCGDNESGSEVDYQRGSDGRYEEDEE